MGRQASRPCGVNHVAVVTANLDVYRACYEETIGLDTALVLAPGPGHGRQAIVFAGDVMLHVFEVGDRASPVPATGPRMLERGRLDHLGFTVRDEAELTEMRRRLVEVGASSGDIRPLGWMLSVRYVDPDGFEGEVNCFNPRFDPSTLRDADEVIDPHWLRRARRALGAADEHHHAHHQTDRGGADHEDEDETRRSLPGRTPTATHGDRRRGRGGGLARRGQRQRCRRQPEGGTGRLGAEAHRRGRPAGAGRPAGGRARRARRHGAAADTPGRVRRGHRHHRAGCGRPAHHRTRTSASPRTPRR